MTIPLPPPDTHCEDLDTGKEVWSYSQELVNGIVERQQMAFWDACSKYGKTGEVIYMTYKTRRDAAIQHEGAGNAGS